ncbi:MAG TPA: hypothetical protein PLP34_05050 [Chitinophagaceae bacterium]|nr:hypothetical protein [Chitinophagaceae bacterium]
MKSIHRLCVCTLGIGIFIFSSCKQKLNNTDAYNLNKDTIPPVLALTVPVELDSYLYGEDIHIVGTITDLMSRNKLHEYPGKLKSLSLVVQTMDIVADTVLKTVFSKNVPVDGKSGLVINELTSVWGSGGVTNCRLKGMAMDYADRRDSVEIHFTVH